MNAEIRKCRSCSKEKPLSEFYKKWRGQEVYSNECAECTKKRTKQQRESLKQNPERLEAHRAKARERQKERRKNRNQEQKRMDLERQYNFVARRREWMESLKTPCEKCGEKRHYVIHWHHIDPAKKVFALSSGCTQAKERILKEQEKCVCLCANCHTEFHHIYGLTPEEPKQALEEYLGKESENGEV